MPQADLGDQLLEALAIGPRGAGEPEIGVDDDDAFLRPAQGHGTLAQGILTLGALGVFDHLPHRGLAHIQVGIAAQVAGGDFGIGCRGHTRTSW